ncbi:MAG TPA: ATPase [Ignisphaera sp.]|nr:ATPase [Ignisphaera sp.]
MDTALILGIAYAGPPLALLGAVGSALGTIEAASAGLSVISEDPAQRSRALALAALPMTQTFYGFIFMYMALSSLGPLIAAGKITMEKSMLLFFISLVVGLAELYSAWTQGKVCRTAISLLPKTRGGIFSMGLILAAYEELFGILALAFGLMVMFAWVLA